MVSIGCLKCIVGWFNVEFVVIGVGLIKILIFVSWLLSCWFSGGVCNRLFGICDGNILMIGWCGCVMKVFIRLFISFNYDWFGCCRLSCYIVVFCVWDEFIVVFICVLVVVVCVLFSWCCWFISGCLILLIVLSLVIGKEILLLVRIRVWWLVFLLSDRYVWFGCCICWFMMFIVCVLWLLRLWVICWWCWFGLLCGIRVLKWFGILILLLIWVCWFIFVIFVYCGSELVMRILMVCYGNIF